MPQVTPCPHFFSPFSSLQFHFSLNVKCYYIAPWLITSQSQKLCFVILNGDREITDWPFPTLYLLLSVNSLRSVWVPGGLPIGFLSTNTPELPLS